MRSSALLLAVVASLSLAACAADSTAPATDDSTESDLTAEHHAALATKVKALYEDAVKAGQGDAKPLPGAADVDASKLRGAARSAYTQYAGNEQSYGYGTPQIMVATVDGYRVFVVSGIISDTGNELGFYDSRGTTLAIAYTGQGEHPNANGVDWE